jgi:hypothetical protein
MPGKRRRAPSPDAIIYSIPLSPEKRTQVVPHFRHDADNDNNALPRTFVSVPKLPTKPVTQTIPEDKHIDLFTVLDTDDCNKAVDPVFTGYAESILAEPVSAAKKRQRPGSVGAIMSFICRI